jgi:hypothetical protein
VLPQAILDDDQYFTKFNLRLPAHLPKQPNRFNGLNYATLGEYKTAFDLRTIRNIIVKQISPKDDDSSIYELFNRLNTGGVNLTAQEIRMSLYHSAFNQMLSRANTRPAWRRLLGIEEPDLRMKDIEFLLHGFAMLEDDSSYNSPMVRFLNGYSRKAKDYAGETVSYLETLFESFSTACDTLPRDAFFRVANRFSVSLFESVFAAVCRPAYAERAIITGKIVPQSVADLRGDQQFQSAAFRRTADKGQVLLRLNRARELIKVQ